MAAKQSPEAVEPMLTLSQVCTVLQIPLEVLAAMIVHKVIEVPFARECNDGSGLSFPLFPTDPDYLDSLEAAYALYIMCEGRRKFTYKGGDTPGLNRTTYKFRPHELLGKPVRKKS